MGGKDLARAPRARVRRLLPAAAAIAALLALGGCYYPYGPYGYGYGYPGYGYGYVAAPAVVVGGYGPGYRGWR
jgi:hypothetical protein